jgi:hypothetical protein
VSDFAALGYSRNDLCDPLFLNSVVAQDEPLQVASFIVGKES